MKALWNWFWNSTSKPVFTVIVFVAGVVVWGGFNTVMEATNTLTFCISCHEMRDNVYVEYKETVHYQNRTGVRAICSDCHVPKSWGHKVIRKIKASNEVFHWLVGTIDTPEKFNTHRLELARNVWTEMKDNGSRECKNCHAFDAMHWEKQGDRAQKTMKLAQEKEFACIECHKGIAHKLPDFGAYYKDLTAALNTAIAEDTLDGDMVMLAGQKTVYMNKDESSDKAFDAYPLSELKVLAREGDWLKVKLEAWDREGSTQLYKAPGPLMEVAKLGGGGMDTVQTLDSKLDAETELNWNKVSVEGWVQKGQMSSDAENVRAYAKDLWRTDCSICHTLYPANTRVARDWTKEIKAMRRFTKLEPEQLTLVQQYVQSGAKDMEGTK